MDSQIIYELFTAVAEASKILETDGGFRKKVLEARDKLPAPEIGKYGQIMEWAEDYDEVEPGHRHISQLFALYPADIITMRKTLSLPKPQGLPLKDVCHTVADTQAGQGHG